MDNRIANSSFVFSCLVVFVHCVPNAIASAERYSSLWWLKELFTETLCRVPVPFFFCVSGFMLAKHIEERGWWWRAVFCRIKTLLVPNVILNVGYWILCFVECLIGHLVFGTEGKMSFVWRTIPDVLGLSRATPFHTVLWYVKQLMLFILVSYPFVWVIKRNKVVAMLLAIGVLLGGLCISKDMFVPIYFGQFFFFLIGLAMRYWKLEPEPLQIYSIVGLVIAVLLQCGICVFTMPMPVVALIRSLVIIPLIAWCVWLIVGDRPWPRILIGTTFALYVTHTMYFHIWGTMTRNVIALGVLMKGCPSAVYLIQGVLGVVVSILLARAYAVYFPKCSAVVFGRRLEVK